MDRYQTTTRVLEILAGRGSCDYAPVHGGIMLFDGEGNRVKEGVDVNTFLDLRSDGLIHKTESMRQGHMVFPANVQVDIYEITDEGRVYLESHN